MPRSILTALTILVLAGSVLAADDKEKKSKDGPRATNVTITKVNVKQGSITVKYPDDKGKTREKTFQLTRDVRRLDDTGRVVKIDVFESGDEALVVESEGKLRELRRTPHVGRTRRLSDAVRTLIKMTDCEEGCTEDLQKIYDMLRKLDTGKNGTIDPRALKAEADHIVQQRVKEVFDRLDANQDGKISKEEGRGLIKEHFDKIDTNKDGFIEFDELLKAAKERREHKPAEARPIDKQDDAKGEELAMRYLLLIFAATLLGLAPSSAWAQVYGDPNALVDYWYRTYLGRAPDPSGLAAWTTQLNQGTPADALLATILGSPEFYVKAGSSPEGYITLLYNDVLKRPPSPGELDFWVRRMYTEDRQAIADEILTHNPGVWVGSSLTVAQAAVVPPSVVVTPGIDWRQHRDWERDRRWDSDRHHDIHDYRRPAINFHYDERHDRHR